jgi:hypothetical protein
VIAFNNFRLIFDLLKADAFYQIIFELQNFGNSEIAFVYAKGHFRFQQFFLRFE